MENKNIQILAERIANLLEESERESAAENDFAFLRSSLEKINKRLDKIEINLNFQSANISHSASRALHSLHPSQEKFDITEAVATQETIENFETEKPCPFEPTGKACDHCSMCSSRGF